MARKTERRPLLTSSPGTRRELIVHRYGQAGGKKAYLHAALHADETPGLLVLHHLVRMLDAADAAGLVTGEVVVVPYANPIGLDQFLNGDHSGRYELAGGGNFNRNWPDIYAMAEDRLAGKLGTNADANIVAIRAELRAALADQVPRNELDSLRLELAQLAVDADLVFDIHCDDDALMHLFFIPAHWPQAADLAAELGAHAVLLAEDSGGNSFDEAFSVPWVRLQRRYPEYPIPAACLAMTVELRGRPDVSDAMAEKDAAALFRGLQRHGVLDGDPGPLPETVCEATPLTATDTLRTPTAGVLSYAVELGARVKSGDLVAWLIDPAAEDPASGRTGIYSRNAGLVLSRRQHKYVSAGQNIAKIVGTEVLDHRLHGSLLED